MSVLADFFLNNKITKLKEKTKRKVGRERDKAVSDKVKFLVSSHRPQSWSFYK